MTPLHYAAYQGRREVVDLLLDWGAHCGLKDDKVRIRARVLCGWWGCWLV